MNKEPKNKLKSYTIGIAILLFGIISASYGVAWKLGYSVPSYFMERCGNTLGPCPSPFLLIMMGGIFILAGVIWFRAINN